MNKYFFTVLLVVVLSANNVQAQFTFGVRAGLNSTKIWGGVGRPTGMKAGFQFGTVADYSFSDKFSIEPKLLFSTQGFKNQMSTTNPVNGKKCKIKEIESPNYIQIPVHVKYKLGNIVSVYAGPYLGFAIGGKRKMITIEDGKKIYTAYPKLFKRDTDGRLMSVYERRFDYGFGVGVAMKFNNIQIGFEGNQGFVGIKQETTSDKNGCLALIAAYMFGK